MTIVAPAPRLGRELLAEIALDRAAARLGLVLAELEAPELVDSPAAATARRAARAALRALATAG